MSRLTRLSNPTLDFLGMNAWGERPIITADVDQEIVQTSQVFPDSSISTNKIGILEVNELLAGSISASNYIQSSNYVASTTGFRLSGDGSAEFNGNVTITGTLHALSGSTIAGFDIGTDYIRDVANSFGLASTVTAGDDVRFWAGSTFANRTSAPFRVTEAGVINATSGTVGGATLGATTIVLGSGANALTLDGANGTISSNGSTWSLGGSGTTSGLVNWATGTTSFNSTATETKTPGFRAKYVLIFATGANPNNGSLQTSIGNSNGTTHVCSYTTSDSGAGSAAQVTTTAWAIGYGANLTSNQAGICNNFTSTQFDLVNTFTNGGNTPTAYITWVAVG